MIDRLKTAAEAGLFLGVKILVVLAVLLLGAGWIVGDYARVRLQAEHGDAVYQMVLKQQQQRQEPAK